VRRTVTEIHPGGDPYVVLEQVPASRTSTTTLATVREWLGGTATVLTEETLAASSSAAFLFEVETGILYRRSNFGPSWFPSRSRVEVVACAGRFADTASVDARFKEACGIVVAHLWRAKAAGPAVAQESLSDGAAHYGVAPWAIPKAAKDLLRDELRPPVLA